MKKALVIICTVLFCCGLYDVRSYAESTISPKTAKTQVVIIGTLHKLHYKNPKYNPEILKGIITSLKPDAILIEQDLSQVDPSGRPLEKFRTKDPNWDPENWITDEVAMQLGIKQIPFDRTDREEYYKKTHYLERRNNYYELMKKLMEELKKNNPESIDLKIVKILDNAFTMGTQLKKNVPPEIINSEGYDALMRIQMSVAFDIMPEILKKYQSYESLFKEGKFLHNVWQERNTIMAKNIVKESEQYPEKRLVVITGAMHRYILKDLLKSEPYIELKEYWEVIKSEPQKCLDDAIGIKQNLSKSSAKPECEQSGGSK
jgi:hypothetical protein